MDPVTFISRNGGAVTLAQLIGQVGRRSLHRALAEGRLVRPFWGTFALPGTPRAVVAAVRYGGVVSHGSAALLWGCRMLRSPDACHVTVPATSPKRATDPGVRLHYADLPPDEVRGSEWSLTSLARTVVDCARTLPLGEAVVVGDSALRRGSARVAGACDGVSADELSRRADALCGPGSRRTRRALRLLDPRAESVLESLFRVLVHLAGLPPPATQVRLLDGRLTVDFYWPSAHVVVEVEGYETHSGRSAWLEDCRRHNRLVANGYRSLRFTWEDVLYGRDYVVETLRGALEQTDVPKTG
ncbi:DUF559 domain-containing protein [Actinoallomurus sp. CA-150999]|uniref:DUF559 domain-containing protein n=1 Tax=Actinoallomurus sp. CA-150999 TaxID=3239887 RepID=UPI003D8F920D